jgi:hypothetical protein
MLVEKPGLCNRPIIDFLATDPVPTMAPIPAGESWLTTAGYCFARGARVVERWSSDIWTVPGGRLVSGDWDAGNCPSDTRR